MLEFSNGGCLVQDISELPNLAGEPTIIADFETASGNKKIKSVNPWHNCYAAGLAITVPNSPRSWYVPVGHYHGGNIPVEPVIDWWCDIVERADRWVNHNVKYDAHVSTNCLGILPECELWCTLTHAKILDSDRIMRGGYGLDALSRTWLQHDISKFELALQPYLGKKNQDYGWIPADVMGEYACQDVLTAGRLYKFQCERKQPEWDRIWNVETKLTYVLFEMERNGLRIDPHEIMKADLLATQRMIILMEELKELVGWTFRPHVNEDCFEVLCGKYQLPIMGWTDSNPPNPSFDQEALKKYLGHPYAPRDIVTRMLEFRTLHTWQSMFLKPYQELNVDGTLHAIYNQCVRTGRMSASKPNSQQLDTKTKQLIHPDDDCVFLDADYDQIEFRTIVHYIQDERCINAYKENPDTDFHRWVAEMCEIHREPAKTINFLMGYGGGKVRLIGGLKQVPELINDLREMIEKLLKEGKIHEGQEMQTFDALATRRGELTYQRYHDELPTLKPTSWRASRVLEARGYVNTIMGRPRRLPIEASYRAFNTLNQGSAADIQKERMVDVADMIKGTPVTLKALVHDSSLFHGPREVMEDPRTQRDLIMGMEDVNCGLRVPIRASYGLSEKSWADANGKRRIPYKSKNGRLSHLK